MAPILAAVSGWIWLLVVPSWERLESKLPTAPAPTSFMNRLPEDASLLVKDRPVLFRDKEAICPFSEQVWLALEVKNIDYVTVLVETTIRDNSWSSPLRFQWPDGSSQTEALEILERIEKVYPGGTAAAGDCTLNYGPNLYPSISKAVDSVRCNIVRFKGVFPRNTQDNPYAPYLIRQKNPDDVTDTSWVPESDHMVTLEETDEVLEEYFQGPFFCGNEITAADIVWAPFLERYAAQLPLIFEGDDDDLTPRSSEYGTLKEWYEAVEERVPAYSCRVMGDKTTWERLFQKGVAQIATPPLEELLPSRGNPIPTNRRKFDADKTWAEYATSTTRPYLAASRELECVAFYVRNRKSVIADAVTTLTNMDANEVDSALREILASLLEGGGADVVKSLSGNARDLLSYLDETLRVPRDMGLLPAATLRTLAAAAPKPRIASR